MLDAALQARLKPTLDALAARLVRQGLGADTVTWVGAGLGLAAALAIARGAPTLGLLLGAASRLADGLDGAVARLTQPTERGAFLDIVLDFLFYASIPLAFAWADPAHNALPAAALLASFIGTGASFLAFAALAARRGLPLQPSAGAPPKGLHFLGGLAEAGETLLCFALMCLWPAWFAPLAWGFAALCAVATLGRLRQGWRLLA
jgi:phosphatidylglycerophosphate synthase